MHKLNILRLQAGLVIDPKIEITEKTVNITEARETPRRKADLRQANDKTLKASIRGCTHAIKHIKAAIGSLEKIPAISFDGSVPSFISELEDLLDSGGDGGIEGYLEMSASELRKMEGQGKQDKRKAEEEEQYAALAATEDDLEDPMATEDEEIGDFIKNLSDDQREQLKIAMDALKTMSGGMIDEATYTTLNTLVGDRLEEAMHYYGVQYDGSHKEDGDKPINVSDGNANDEQVWDEQEEKNESPEQLRTMDQQDNSEQDKSGDDLSTKIKVPNGIKQALRTEIEKANQEAGKNDVRNKEASYFYKDLAKAFEDLLGHLEKGTRYDLKQAQIFAQTLMGPMLHKLPTNVWKYLTNGGETRSLKSYIQAVPKKYPITGPRNTLK